MEKTANIYAQAIYPHGHVEAGRSVPDFQRTMLDATPDCIKVLSPDGVLTAMNRAGCTALNIPADGGFGMPWLQLLPAEVRVAGQAALDKAAAGQTSRFQGHSEAPFGVMFWDNLLTPFLDSSGQVSSILCVSRDVTEKVHLETRLEEAIKREKLLTGEMQHRIKNLFSVVSGLISMTEREAAQPQAEGSLSDLLRGKLAALSRASDIAFSDIRLYGSEVGQVELGALVAAVLKPYGDRSIMSGDQSTIGQNVMTTLALFLHELATNSSKYGALGMDGGTVSINWTTADEMLDLTWTEAGGPPVTTEPGRRGFGSEMVDRMVRHAGGSVERAWPASGLVATLRLPALPNP